MKEGWTGKESAGKSQLMAVKAWKIYKRNVRWINQRQKAGLEFIPRTMAFDTPMSDFFIKAIESRGMKYLHFRSLRDVLPLTQVDVFINEINKYFPARGTEPLTPDQAEFLSQAAKLGVHIYFCCQDFSQTHKQFRFLVNKFHYVAKICGSIRPIASAPPVKRIWGIALVWSLNPDSFKGDNTSMDITSFMSLPSIYFFNKPDTELYDTLHLVKPLDLPVVTMAKQKYIFINPDGSVAKEEDKWVRR